MGGPVKRRRQQRRQAPARSGSPRSVELRGPPCDSGAPSPIPLCLPSPAAGRAAGGGRRSGGRSSSGRRRQTLGAERRLSAPSGMVDLRGLRCRRRTSPGRRRNTTSAGGDARPSRVAVLPAQPFMCGHVGWYRPTEQARSVFCGPGRASGGEGEAVEGARQRGRRRRASARMRSMPQSGCRAFTASSSS